MLPAWFAAARGMSDVTSAYFRRCFFWDAAAARQGSCPRCRPHARHFVTCTVRATAIRNYRAPQTKGGGKRKHRIRRAGSE
jgi:hypothetical protein